MSDSPLFLPYTFRCGATAHNRITLAPLTNLQSHDDGQCSQEELRWLERRARGGFAIVMTCAAYVSATGKGFAGQLGCCSDDHLPGLEALARAINRHGALSMVQLFHGGARAPRAVTGVQPISASAWEETSSQLDSPRAATTAEIEQVIEDFCTAAHRVHRAGFRGVEIHGAHGYLPCQFLSWLRNTRADGWGGSLAGRARLLRTITARIRAEIPPPFIVGVRLSPEDMPAIVGLDLDESIQVAQWLAEDGIDFVDLSLWDYRRPTKKRPTEFALPLFREALPREVAVLAAGAIWTPEDAAAVLGQGADFVALGRAAILNPDWPKLARDPHFEPQRGPFTPAQLNEIDVSPKFVDYLRRFQLVADTEG
jgi:2,4-dienoyl-CoA reductase-like NADH-dependent reductase (Old Yellow Enzyme family)